MTDTISFSIRRENFNPLYLNIGDANSRNVLTFLASENGNEIHQWVSENDDVHIIKLQEIQTYPDHIEITHYEIRDERVAALFLLRWQS